MDQSDQSNQLRVRGLPLLFGSEDLAFPGEHNEGED